MEKARGRRSKAIEFGIGNAECGKLKQMSEVGGRRAKIRGRQSGDRSQRTEVRRWGQKRWKMDDGRLEDRKIGKAENGSKEPYNKDKIKNDFDIKIKHTHHLIEKIQNNELPDKIMLNVHPQRWNDRFGPWVKELVWQNVKNVVKQIINHRLRCLTLIIELLSTDYAD
jgi:hypothetical protein